jgi:hypothetical protein
VIVDSPIRSPEEEARHPLTRPPMGNRRVYETFDAALARFRLMPASWHSRASSRNAPILLMRPPVAGYGSRSNAFTARNSSWSAGPIRKAASSRALLLAYYDPDGRLGLCRPRPHWPEPASVTRIDSAKTQSLVLASV